jgi:hypothetical protein
VIRVTVEVDGEVCEFTSDDTSALTFETPRDKLDMGVDDEGVQHMMIGKTSFNLHAEFKKDHCPRWRTLEGV